MRRAAAVGIALGVAYVAVFSVNVKLGGTPRPIYDGGCPDIICSPPPYTPYSPPPRPTPSSLATPTTQPGPGPRLTPTPTPGRATPGIVVATPQPTGSSSGTPQASTSGLIGAGGGTAAAPDGGAVVQVPIGAVSAPVAITIESVVSGAPASPPGQLFETPVWELRASSPAGPVIVFNKPITVVLKYAAQPPAFVCYWDGEAWIREATALDPTHRTASARVPHLTMFAGLAAAAGANGGGGGTPAVGRVSPFVIIAALLVPAALIVGAALAVRGTPARPPRPPNQDEE